jgi:RimJ/RimL family protein N-acetyltransferase
VREATEADAAMLLDWRNDERTRRWSRTTRPVAMDDHIRWLRAAVGAPSRLLLVAEAVEQTPVGTIRFDRVAAGVWEVSITVAPDQRGRGWSAPLLAVGERELRRRREVTTVVASVHADNAVSLALFHGAGYRAGEPRPPGPDRFRRFTKSLEVS